MLGSLRVLFLYFSHEETEALNHKTGINKPCLLTHNSVLFLLQKVGDNSVTDEHQESVIS